MPFILLWGYIYSRKRTLKSGNFYKYRKIIKKSIAFLCKSIYICESDNNNPQ